MNIKEIAHTIYTSEGNYNNADKTSGQKIHREDEIEDILRLYFESELSNCNIDHNLEKIYEVLNTMKEEGITIKQ